MTVVFSADEIVASADKLMSPDDIRLVFRCTEAILALAGERVANLGPCVLTGHINLGSRAERDGFMGRHGEADNGFDRPGLLAFLDSPNADADGIRVMLELSAADMDSVYASVSADITACATPGALAAVLDEFDRALRTAELSCLSVELLEAAK